MSRNTAFCDLWFRSHEVMKFRPCTPFSVYSRTLNIHFSKYTKLRQFLSYYQNSDSFRKLKHVRTLSVAKFSLEKL